MTSWDYLIPNLSVLVDLAVVTFPFQNQRANSKASWDKINYEALFLFGAGCVSLFVVKQ